MPAFFVSKEKAMKKLLCLALALFAALSLCACSGLGEQPEPTPTPEPEGVDLWVRSAEKLYNMEYDGFAGYFDSVCNGFYGDSVNTVLSVIPFEDKDEEISQKRAEYAEKYGDDWHYTVVDRKETELDEKACKDFAAELEDVSEKAAVLVDAAEKWDEHEWSDFAESNDCTVSDAKKLVNAYKAIVGVCHEAKVTKAVELELTLEFSGSKTKTAQTTQNECVYEVNGVFVSEMLLDYSYALINIVY